MLKNKAIVVGAGPAGLSASIGLARAGYEVRIFEQRSQWQGRVCGAFLNPEAVAHLKWLGILDRVLKESVQVRSSQITFGKKIFNVPIVQMGIGALGLERKILEEILLMESTHLGVKIEMGIRFQKENYSNDSNLLVSAAGRFSQGTTKNSTGWYGWNATFENVHQQPGEMSLHFYPRGYVGVLTFGNHLTNICGLVYRTKHQPLVWEDVFLEALDQSKSFQKQMKNSARMGEWRGVGPLPFSKNGFESLPELPVGDSAAVGDPFMGEGNGRALGAGPMLYSALQENAKGGDLPIVYEQIWRRAYQTRFRMGAFVRTLMKFPNGFSFLAQEVLSTSWFVRRATPHFHQGFLVKVNP